MYETFSLRPPYLISDLHYTAQRFNELLDPENVGVASEILMLSTQGPEM